MPTALLGVLLVGELANLVRRPVHECEICVGRLLLPGLKGDPFPVERELWAGFAGLAGVGEILWLGSRGGNEIEVVDLIPTSVLLVDNPAAILSPDFAGLSVVGPGELVRSGAVCVHQPQVDAAGCVAAVDNLLAVRRPGGAAKTHGVQQVFDVHRACA
jgi:hypothetical protein